MVTELVGRARRRYLWNELLAQGAWAVSAALAAVIVLLLVGTEILDWRWMVALPAATLAAGVWLTLRRLPPAYTVAQAVDHRLRLADSLSTALYFAGRADRASDGVREAQRAQAERLARGLDMRLAVPFTMPRAVYSVAILGVAASGLFALRYGMSHRLDLRQPLASIIQQAFGLDRQQAAALERQKPDPPQKRPEFNEMQALAAAEGQTLPEGKLEGVEAIDASGSPADRKEASRSQGNEGGEEGDQIGGEEGEQPAGFSTGNEQGQQGQGKSREGKQSASRQQGPGESGSNSSLMDKFRDAMQNLMSRMRPPSPGSQGGQPQQAKNGQQQGQPQAGAGQPGKEGQQQPGGQQGEGQQGQQGSESQAAQNATGRGSGKSGDENPSQQPGSGIGKQDGDKELRTAEQLAAMGKISEIIGKRSANVTGEVTVEVQSGSQQLQTPYSRRRATQGEAIAEISRDEVPVALESYVQQYFEQVRKAAPEQAKR